MRVTVVFTPDLSLEEVQDAVSSAYREIVNRPDLLDKDQDIPITFDKKMKGWIRVREEV